jgi:hypothetical protein
MMDVECMGGKLKPAELDQKSYLHRRHINNSRALNSYTQNIPVISQRELFKSVPISFHYDHPRVEEEPRPL